MQGGANFASATLSVSKLPLVVAAGYCKDGLGEVVLQELAEATRIGRIWFVFALDGNCDGEELLSSPVVRSLKAQLIRLPEDVKICWASELGSVIDHVVCASASHVDEL